MTNLSALASSFEPHIVYITALEMPSLSNLHASQVLAPASQLAMSGCRVTWIAVIPYAMRIKDIVCSTRRLHQVSAACAEQGVEFLPFYVPLISNASLSSFYFKDLILRHVAHRIFATVSWSERTILHGRSYYATEIACCIRDMQRNESCKVSFDMRSIFPEEMPITSSSILGKMAFGFMKQWEFELLRNSDIMFLPLHYARNRIYSETGAHARYLPVQGFDRELGWQVDFDKRWEQARLGYAGSIGAWHSPEILLRIFQALPWMTPRLAMKPHPLFAQYDCHVYANNDMPKYYDELLGLVIPGRHDVDDYFMSFQMRCNLFSTKAAEALSRGVPLVVSSGLFELATFVRENRCGFVYDPDAHEFIFPDKNAVAEKSVWAEMTANAVAVGEKFTRIRIVDEYLANWRALFEKDASRS